MYKCGICEKDFETIAERNRCEAICIKRIEEDAKRLAEEKKKAEQEARRLEVEKAIVHATELLEAYITDYKTYEFNTDAADSWMWPSKLLSWFI
jgi:hypothetical protein